MSGYLELKGKRTLVTGGTKGGGAAVEVLSNLIAGGSATLSDRAALYNTELSPQRPRH